nr:ribonuclease H-like domain-containing protein [Tanacetum cinerariifolium]
MPPSIEEDDDDSRDILIREELLDNYSLPIPENESFHFDISSFSRPPAKPPDGFECPSIPGNVKTHTEGFYLQSLHFLSFNWELYLGSLNYFLVIFVTRDSSRMFLSQKKYAVEIFKKAHIVNYNYSWTLVDSESKLGADDDPISDLTLYQSLAVSLQYLTFTRPNISYVVQQVCLYMHEPREPYFLAFKRVLMYVRGTLNYGLQLFSSSTTDLVAYSDADWAGFPTTSTKAEYCGVANAVAETCWLRNLL